MKTVFGKFDTYAKLLKFSTTSSGRKIASFEAQFPRMVLAELNTHAMLAKNSASSRAIPFTKMVEQLRGRPTRFGQANPGMQDKGVDYGAPVIVMTPGPDPEELWLPPEAAWEAAKEAAVEWAHAFYAAGYHKQVYNRLTEPFQLMKTVITATEFANLFWLRDHGAADPTIAELVRCMRECLKGEEPQVLYAGEWHLPYVETEVAKEGEDEFIRYWIESDKEEGGRQYLDTQEAIKVSAARSAAVSFRNVDYGLEKSSEVHERLVGDDRKHASAMEHQATPMEAAQYMMDANGTVIGGCNIATDPSTWQEGISHCDRNKDLWSGKFNGWIQYRKLIPGENKPGFDLE